MSSAKGGSAFAAKVRDLAKKVGKSRTLRMGFLEGATHPGGGLPVAAIAAIQNYGAPKRKIPPRPFFSNMVKDGKANWPKLVATNFKATGGDVVRTLELVGEELEGELRQAIQQMNAPALSPVTVMLRGMRANDPALKVTARTVGIAARRVRQGKTNYGASIKPLIDSADMYKSVDSEVV